MTMGHSGIKGKEHRRSARLCLTEATGPLRGPRAGERNEARLGQR
jgi:hypothetical protein